MATVYKSSNTTKLNDYQIYSSDYYTGCDVSVFFGNVWIDEINSIGFSMEEKAMPVFGYADYVYNRILKGNRVVQGSFRLNFTESGYLYTIMDAIKGSKADIKSIASTAKTSYALDQMKFQYKNKSGLTITAPFEEYADNYEDLMWGKKDTAVSTINSPLLAKQTFDIVITYGPYVNKAHTLSTKASNSAKSTVKIIRDVCLTGVSQVVEANDNPIMEEYTFIGRSVDTI